MRSINYGYYQPVRVNGWSFGIGGSDSTIAMSCQEYNTYYNVTLIGTQDNEENVLFETKLNYKDHIANTKKRNKELKNMINKATRYIGANIADRIIR